VKILRQPNQITKLMFSVSGKLRLSRVGGRALGKIMIFIKIYRAQFGRGCRLRPRRDQRVVNQFRLQTRAFYGFKRVFGWVASSTVYSIFDQPKMALSGERSSCETTARKKNL